jgi:hypothetical protein
MNLTRRSASEGGSFNLAFFAKITGFRRAETYLHSRGITIAAQAYDFLKRLKHPSGSVWPVQWWS